MTFTVSLLQWAKNKQLSSLLVARRTLCCNLRRWWCHLDNSAPAARSSDGSMQNATHLPVSFALAVVVQDAEEGAWSTGNCFSRLNLRLMLCSRPAHLALPATRTAVLVQHAPCAVSAGGQCADGTAAMQRVSLADRLEHDFVVCTRCMRLFCIFVSLHVHLPALHTHTSTCATAPTSPAPTSDRRPAVPTSTNPFRHHKASMQDHKLYEYIVGANSLGANCSTLPIAQASNCRLG